MKIESAERKIDKIYKNNFKKIKIRIILFWVISMLILIPSLWFFPGKIEIKHIIGITILDLIIYGIAILKEKELI